VQVTRHDSCWVTPFGNPRINASLPTPQGISQAGTSFIGSRCQGIHHVPLPTCQTNPQHNKQHTTKTCHRRVMALNQQSIRDTTFKRTIITLQTTHTKGACGMLASTIQESRNKSPTSPRPDHSPNRRLMPQTPNSMPCTPAETGERYECACLRPLVNTPNRHGTVVRAHEVCSLERR
jgi:hypothetical protein